MNPLRTPGLVTRVLFALALTATLFAVAPLNAARRTSKSRKQPITKLTFDPAAESVQLFDGLDEGQLDAWMVMKDSFGGKVFVENKTDKPLSVELPPAIAGVHVLNQIGGLGGGGGGGGGGGQSVGGGLGGGIGGGGLGGFGGGGGVFSIPPESVAMLKCTTVCLNHGKPDPRPKMKYRLVRIEHVTTDAVLTELLAMVGSGRLDKHSAQAAAWHLTDEMSWRDLATKSVRHISFTKPYFTARQIARGRSILAHAQGRARQKAEQTTTGDTQSRERVKSRPARTR